MRRPLLSCLVRLVPLLWCPALADLPIALADGPEDNRPDQVRPIPPPGQELPAATAEALRWRCTAVRAQWQSLLAQPQADPQLDDLAGEVLVFPRAVELALECNQIYTAKEPESASLLLDEATRRLRVLQQGGQWADVVGLGDGREQQLIIGGYTSRIDGSHQPYGLVIPRGLGRDDVRPRRLDLWFHGRGEKLSELAFLAKQQSDPGPYTPADTIVLHPYGRYCNAFKFAGEVDVLEALDHVRAYLPVDPDRIGVRGFSMGGAACWQFATHYADRWFAANPGAGFSETPQFLQSFQGEDARATAPDYQQTLWQLYDCPDWVVNLTHCPTVVYSGQQDRQKQAADVMAEAMQEIGVDMLHVIGPETAHSIHPQSKLEIESRLASLAKAATSDVPRQVEFVTFTLRYHRMHWVEIQGLGKHWTPARVSASIEGPRIRVTTSNVTRLRLTLEAGQWPGPASGPVMVEIDGTELTGPLVRSDRSWQWELMRQGDAWRAATDPDPDPLRKRPGIQGPIDDAFLDSFLFVLPSGTSGDETVQRWIQAESQHAMQHWRTHFRGDVRKKLDSELTEQDVASANLILFGDPDSNATLRLILADLPVAWQDDTISIGQAEVPRRGHVPALIYPNPLNPSRYIVLNSGFTFREYDYLNNARQTPKLPDWALIDIRQGATMQAPGIVTAAGFFDESWQP